jgi:hypothetical protein
MAHHAVLDHNIRKHVMAFTQFIRILLLVEFPRSRHTLSGEANFSRARVYVGLPIDLAIRGELEEVNHSPLYCGN